MVVIEIVQMKQWYIRFTFVFGADDGIEEFQKSNKQLQTKYVRKLKRLTFVRELIVEPKTIFELDLKCLWELQTIIFILRIVYFIINGWYYSSNKISSTIPAKKSFRLPTEKKVMVSTIFLYSFTRLTK